LQLKKNNIKRRSKQQQT